MAFLEGYGLVEAERPAAIERVTLMLVLDGLIMSFRWAQEGNGDYLGRHWLVAGEYQADL